MHCWCMQITDVDAWLYHTFTMFRYHYVLLDIVLISNPAYHWNDSKCDENVPLPKASTPAV